MSVALEFELARFKARAECAEADRDRLAADLTETTDLLRTVSSDYDTVLSDREVLAARLAGAEELLAELADGFFTRVRAFLARISEENTP